MPHSAVVSGHLKLLHFYERPDIPMLFNLQSDRGEVHNIAATSPAAHQRLFREMMDYFDLVGARLPRPNPSYRAAAYEKAKEYERRRLWGPFNGRRPLEDDEKNDTDSK